MHNMGFSMFIALLALLVMFTIEVCAADTIYTSFFSTDAVGGYDTVAYFTEGKPIKGKNRYKVELNVASWLFAS